MLAGAASPSSTGFHISSFLKVPCGKGRQTACGLPAAAVLQVHKDAKARSQALAFSVGADSLGS